MHLSINKVLIYIKKLKISSNNIVNQIEIVELLIVQGIPMFIPATYLEGRKLYI